MTRAKASNMVCECCGKDITKELPALVFNEPILWNEESSILEGSELTTDLCVIENKHYFVRCNLEIPIVNSDIPLTYGVWCSVSKENFERYCSVYGTKKEFDEAPFFGWMCNQIPFYKDTLHIKCNIHLQGNSMRPLVELDHTNKHKLCQEQHNGITLERAHEIVKLAFGDNYI
jgi:hypothetical protein